MDHLRIFVFAVFLLFIVSLYGRTSADFLFPTDVSPPTRRPRPQGHRRAKLIEKPEAVIVGCSTEDTFCEDVRNYPSSQVESAVQSNATAAQFIRDNFEEKDSGIFGRKRPTDADRSEKRVCDVISKTIYPKAAKTSANVWKYVVNTGTTYKQGITIEMCSEENSPCHMCTNRKSRCVQTFVGRKMLVFDENSLDSYSDLFNFPSSCVCYVDDLV